MDAKNRTITLFAIVKADENESVQIDNDEDDK